MNFCCAGFRNFVSLAGDRGIAIVCCEFSSGRIGFLVQSRGIAYGDERKLKPWPFDITINISSEMGLRYCPSCGRELDELINSAPDEFCALAQQHKKFVASVPGL